MYKITILGCNEKGKLYGIKTIMARFNLTVREGKEWIDALPRTLDAEYTKEDVEWFREHFICDICDVNRDEYSYNTREPDADTKLALEWYEAQPKYVQDMVDAIGKWNNPIVLAGG